MKQDERWNLRYQEVMDFITANHRNPSRHRIEEHDMLNWVKANRKMMNKGEMKEERVERFRELMEMMERCIGERTSMNSGRDNIATYGTI